MHISAQIDMSGAIAKLRDLPQKIQDKAITQTINEVATRGRAEMKRQIASEWNIKSGEADSQLRLSKATTKKELIQAVLSAVGSNGSSRKRSRNVIFFDARPVLGTYMRKSKNGTWSAVRAKDGGGVSVRISRRSGRKLLPKAFIGNKGRTVFERTGEGRGIRPINTIDVPSMFNTRIVNKAVVDKIRQELITSTQRALRRFSS